MSTSNQPSFERSQPVIPNSPLATASLVLGILGWTFLPILGGLAAVITGHIAKNEIKKSNGLLSGDGMATAGLVLGYTSIVPGLCACLVFLLLIPMLGGLWFYTDQIINTLP